MNFLFVNGNTKLSSEKKKMNIQTSLLRALFVHRFGFWVALVKNEMILFQFACKDDGKAVETDRELTGVLLFNNVWDTWCVTINALEILTTYAAFPEIC
jgi:hypothetical protein